MDMLTATYKLSKYSAKIFAPPWKSKHSLKSSKDFMNKIKTKEIPTGYQMVSLDVKCLLTMYCSIAKLILYYKEHIIEKFKQQCQRKN